MKHAVLLTHGPIGEAIVEAVRGIMGMDEGLHSISVTNMSVAEITQRLSAVVNGPEEKREGAIIMASLKGGSCWNVAVTVARNNPHVTVISGVNLPMALSFMTKRDSLPLAQLTETLEKDGYRSITTFDNKQR
jgi:mannose/fructose-specific phosphotransferase system component IIA